MVRIGTSHSKHRVRAFGQLMPPAVIMACVVACTQRMDTGPWHTPQAPPQASVSAPPAVPDDPPFPTELQLAAPQRVQFLSMSLSVLHVRIPRASRAQVAPVWNHLREDEFSHAARVALHENGMRAGVGDSQQWDAVKAALDNVDGVRSSLVGPVRLPPGFPFALQMDDAPREQTLFCMAADGTLTGQTWPESRNVLRLTCQHNLTRPDHVRVAVVPEVRQRLAGWRWVRGEAGLAPEPRYDGRAFPEAAVTADLGPGEFLLVAPGPRADLFGMIGGAFLTRDIEDERYDVYVFLRIDVNHVAYRQ